MNKEIQPKVYAQCTVTCACGNSFVTSSTHENIKVEICSACHPFYTGQQKFVDTEGRIDKFKKKQQISVEKKKTADVLKTIKTEKKAKAKKSSSDKQPTLKEMLEQARNQNS